MAYFIEVTDLFCGELNYSFVERYLIEAKDLSQVMRKLNRYTGRRGARKQWSQGEDSAVYHYGKLIGVSIEYLNPEQEQETIGSYLNITRIGV